ncbi:MAG: hypothetical protein ACOVKJ_02240, partial [Flavobacterium sp.]
MSFIDPSIQQIDVNLSQTEAGVSNLSKVVLRGSTILNNPSEFNVSVSKLTCPLNYSVPLWIPLINLQSENIFESIYSITLEYNGIYSTQTYLPIYQTNTAIAPSTFLEQPTNLWGAVYNYNTILQMLNAAFSAAYTSLTNQLTSGTLSVDAPSFTWNNATETTTFNAYPFEQYDQSGPTPVNIYFNNVASLLFQGYNSTRLTTQVTPEGRDNLLVVTNMGNNWKEYSTTSGWTSPPGPPSSTAYLQESQQYSTTYVYQAMQSILVVTNLPIISSYTDLPISSQASGANNSQLSVLTSFSIDYSQAASAFNSPVVYAPTSIINSQPINMTGSQEITSFTIGLYWQDNKGYTHPLQTICPAQNALIRLA